VVFRPSVLRRAAVAFGFSLVLASSALLLWVDEEESPTLASEGASRGAAWTPAPVLALLIVAAMSGLVLLVSLRPRRG
jgi:hypothetical protein